MRTIILQLFLLVGSFVISHGTELEEVDVFLEDIIKTWKLQSPTIIVKDYLSNVCMKHQWLLCLSNHQDANDIANHLSHVHRHNNQDGIIMVGSHGHDELLRHLMKDAPTIFASNHPFFMPLKYQNSIQLRLDSNVVFYDDQDGNYEMYDIFAVKGGPFITMDVGNWNLNTGMMISKSLNRWDRRTDLQDTTFVNCLQNYLPFAQFTEDKNGNINGSAGFFQDILFYITDKLNMAVDTVAHPWKMVLLENGSWTGGIGLLQRQEADVITTGLGLNIQRSYYIDFPIPTHRQPIELIAATPEGVSINMWAYLGVFGVFQWMIFITLLVLMAIGLSVIFTLDNDLEFAVKRSSNNNYQLNSKSSALAIVFLYTIQMGSHTNSKKLAPRLLTLTLSILTLLLFAFFTTDLTAEMTSGPPDIPISSFEDVILLGYKVVTYSPYYNRTLASSKPGSAKLEVYNNNFEMIMDKDEAVKAVIEDPDSKNLTFWRTVNTC